MSREPTDEEHAEAYALVYEGHAADVRPHREIRQTIEALVMQRNDARAEAAMAGAAEDGAMASANDLLERLDKAEAAREAWQADAERLYEALKREMEANDGKLLASTVWSGVLEDHEKLVRKLNE